MKMSIRNKMIFAVYLILIPIIVLTGLFTTVTNYQDTIEGTVEIYQRFTSNISNDISYIQQDVIDISDYFAVNSNVHNVLVSSPAAYHDDNLFWYSSTPLSIIKDILAIKSHLKTLILYPTNGLAPFYLSRDASVQKKDIYEVEETDYYRKAEESSGDLVWARVNESDTELYIDNKSDKIEAYRVLYDLSKKHQIGFLVIGTDVTDYEKVCRGMLQNENEGIVVLGKNGEEFIRVGLVDDVLLQKLKEPEKLWGEGNAQEYIREDDYYIF